MGFYHPATLVKDAQRRGVRFASIDVQMSKWNCFVQEDGSIRLGLRYVRGLSAETGRRIEATPGAPRFASIDALARAVGLRQDDLRTMAEVGAFAPFGGDRRTALWQAEVAGRQMAIEDSGERLPASFREKRVGNNAGSLSPLPSMSLVDRVAADYAGTGLTIGPHPMALLRPSLATRGVMRASDLARARPGRRVRVAGAVLVRQRPGTAKGFVFLSLEDETGIANAIVTPGVFAANKRVIVDEPYLVIEGPLQNQDGAVSVKVDRVDALRASAPEMPSHNFH
jgi:error-prone DNA polymerase